MHFYHVDTLIKNHCEETNYISGWQDSEILVSPYYN